MNKLATGAVLSLTLVSLLVVDQRAAAAPTLPEKTVAQVVPASLAQVTASVKIYARFEVKARKWPIAQWVCLEKLWTKESNWRYVAKNSSSGAYGIPQALPGTKMATAGADWKTNPFTQVDWGLKYIESRYKTPCGALKHWQRKGWY